MMSSRRVIAAALGMLLSGLCMAVEGDAAPQKAPPPDPAVALRALQREHDALLAQQPALQEAAGRAATLSDQNQQLEQQLQALQGQIDGLRDEATRLRESDSHRWFVTGAAVLGAGLLLGAILPAFGGRRRRGYGGFR